jgi:unsaturated rhamnogalacturonyl hydrolase
VSEAVYHLTNHIESPTAALPDDKRVPNGLNVCPVLPDGTLTRLFWSEVLTRSDEARLRLTVALDVREEKLIEVSLLQTGEVIGTLDIRYAYIFQLFEIVLNAAQKQAAIHHGIGLRMIQGEEPLWFFVDDRRPDALFRPHLLLAAPDDPVQQFYQRMRSLDSLQPFSWMEGCVLDGLLDLHHIYPAHGYDGAAKAHLEFFLDSARTKLVYEDPRSRPADDRVYGIEGTLPFAAMAQIWPDHPALDQAVEFWLSHQTAEGAVQDATTLSAEGCYTVAYPMAVVARQRGDDQLAALALQQLSIRRDYLLHQDALYLRHHTHDDSRTFRNWARGCAWYLLGFIRTLAQLPDHPETDRLLSDFAQAAQQVAQYAQPNGLWACFIDEPEVSPDTSGSAGIAAALALGVRVGVLDDSCRQIALQTAETLKQHLTPDGFLTGVAQSNRGGEALQRSNYRVIMQMGMGLMAQLIAAL